MLTMALNNSHQNCSGPKKGSVLTGSWFVDGTEQDHFGRTGDLYVRFYIDSRELYGQA